MVTVSPTTRTVHVVPIPRWSGRATASTRIAALARSIAATSAGPSGTPPGSSVPSEQADGQVGGDVAGQVATHAVRDGEHRRACEGAILVVGPDATDRRPDGEPGVARWRVRRRQDVRPRSDRKMATAFWPPNPKPLTATVSTFARRAVSGT